MAETKDYHIGIIFYDDVEKQMTMITCKRLGIRISSVWEALSHKRGIQTPYDSESYKQLWQVWTLLRKIKCPVYTVAEARQETLNKVKAELEWLERGAAPIYNNMCLAVLTNGEVDDAGEYQEYSKEERLKHLSALMDELRQDPTAADKYKEDIHKRIEVRTDRLLEDELFCEEVNSNFPLAKMSYPQITYHEVAELLALKSMQIRDKLTLRARYDERPTYAKELENGVLVSDRHNDSMSSKARKMLGNIIDVHDLTDEEWRKNVSELHTALTTLNDVIKVEVKHKEADKNYEVKIPLDLVQAVDAARITACTHTLRDHNMDDL